MERAGADKSYLSCCDYTFYHVQYVPIVGCHALFYLAEANRLFIDLHKYSESVASAGCDKIPYYCEAIMHLLWL